MEYDELRKGYENYNISINISQIYVFFKLFDVFFWFFYKKS